MGTRRSGKESGGGLNPQQRLFVHEYLLDRNATQAAIRAGYSERSAGSQAHDLLKKPEIAGLVEKGLRRLEEKYELKLERVVLELHRILYADPIHALRDDGTVKPLNEWPEDLRRAMSGMEIEEIFEEVDTGEVGPRGGKVKEKVLVGYLKKYKFWAKPDASNQLLRVLGAYKDRLEVEQTQKPHAQLVAEAARRLREELAAEREQGHGGERP
jgi:phage terminase small subunit